MKSSEPMNINTKLENVKFCQGIQNFSQGKQNKAKFQTFQKPFPYFAVSYEFVLQSVKSLIRIF